MRTKIFKLLPILIIAPTLMANSPIPKPSDSEYRDVVVSYSFIEEKDNSLWYEFEITNTGDSFALINHSLLNENNGYYGEIIFDVFRDECLAPNQTKNYKFRSTKYLDDIEQGERWTTICYTEQDDNVTWSNALVKKGSSYHYIKADFKNLGDYYYSAIVKLEYQGETYYVDAAYNSNKYLNLFIEQDIDLNDIVIKEMTFYKSSFNTYKGGKILTYIIYIFIGLLALAILLIPAAIIVPVSIASHKRKKRKNINNQVD